jgi:hypothetical protein
MEQWRHQTGEAVNDPYFCSVLEDIASIRLYTPLRKGV